jgi:LysM repeat protein
MGTRRRRARLLGLIGGALFVGPVLAGSVLATDDPIVVQAGDTLSELALEHGVAIEQIVALNQIADPDRIYVGQQLQLVSAAPASAEAAAAAAAPGAHTHVVVRGENLTWIARHYGTTVAALVAANGIPNPSRIYAGQQLTIPAEPTSAEAHAAVAPPAPAAPAPAEASAAPVPVAEAAVATTHVVARGENLTWIARRYGTTVDAIVVANGISNPSRIYAGQSLTIPVPVSAESPPATPATAPGPDASREAMRQLIVEESARFGVPAPLALAVAWQESGWRQDVVSRAGAIGVMQLLPATAEWVAMTMLGEPVEPYDARSNVRAGVRLLAHYLERYGGQRELVLAAYYQGQTAADRAGVYASSWPYVNSIIALEAAFAD